MQLSALKYTVVKLLSPAKTLYPILTTALPMVTEVKLVHPLNAYSPILSELIVAEVRL
jgi:hypothetical protein